MDGIEREFSCLYVLASRLVHGLDGLDGQKIDQIYNPLL